MPVLTVIAGPNGAGKSVNSSAILLGRNISSFDFDLLFYAEWKRFSYDPLVERGVSEFIDDLFLKQKQVAISTREDFSFETNYHSDKILSTINEFRISRFKTELIFLLLESPDIAIKRVKDRVVRGGHSVDEETIHNRFSKGLLLLDLSFNEFDVVSIYLSKENELVPISLIEPKIQKVEQFNKLPESLSDKLPRLTRFVSNHS